METKEAQRTATATETSRPRAAMYLRQSLDKDMGTVSEGAAVERQRSECEALAKRRGLDIVVTFTDNDVSASSSKPRPAFERMLAAAERGDIDVIVVQVLDRLLRKMGELERVVELVERTGVKVHLVSGDLDLSTDAGRLVGRILAAVARGEVERKSARQKLANAARAEQGLARTNRRRSFGYGQDGMTVIKSEAALIREAYVTVLAGGSLHRVAQQWQASGIPTMNGGKRWGDQVVRQILLNPRNAGLSAYKGEVVGKGTWPAIIEESTWDATRVLLTDPSRRKTVNATKRTRQLSGLALCGVCGETVKAASRPTDGAKTYRCRLNKHVVRQAEPLEKYVRLNIIEWLDQPSARELLEDANAPDLDEVRREVIAKRELRKDLAIEFAEGYIDKAALRAGTARLNASIESMERQLVRDSELMLLPLLGRAHELWDDLDLHRQRAVINALCAITIYPLGRGNREQSPLTKVKIAWHKNPLATG
jgi:DNA invertase Pin-like site-specific DNA recombinase